MCIRNAARTGTTGYPNRSTAIRFLLMLGLLAITIPTPLVAAQTSLILDPGSHSARITALAFSPDGRFLASSSEDKTIRLWSLADGMSSRILRGMRSPGPNGKVYCLDFSPDGRSLVAGGWFTAEHDGCFPLRVFRPADGEITALLSGHRAVVLAVTFSPDGKRLVSGDGDGRLLVWDASRLTSDSRPLLALADHKSPIYGLAITADNKHLVSAARDGTVFVHHLDGSRIATATVRQPLYRIAVAPDGREAALGSGDGAVQRFSLPDLQPLGTAIRVPQDSLEETAYSPDGRFLACGGLYQDPARPLGEGRNARPLYIIERSGGRVIADLAVHDNTIQALRFSRDGKILAVAGGDNHAIVLVDFPAFRMRPPWQGRGRAVYRVGFSPSGHELLFGTSDRGGPRHAPLEYGFSLDGFTLRTAGPPHPDSEPDGTRPPDTIIREPTIARVGELALPLYREGNRLHDVLLMPDKARVLLASDFGLEIRDARSGEKLADLVGHSDSVTCLALSPDGQFVASGSLDQTIRLWRPDGLHGTVRFHEPAMLARMGQAYAALCEEYGVPDPDNPAAVPTLYRLLAASGDRRAGLLLASVPQLPITAGFFLTKDGEYLAWTADSYYTGHKRLFSMLGWQIDRGPAHASRFYPFAQFDLHANRPDLVLERIGYVEETLVAAYRQLHERRLARAGFSGTTQPGELHLPELQLRADAPGGRAGGERVVFNVSAEDSRFPLRRLFFFVNDVPFPDAAGIALPQGRKQYSGSHALRLPPGPCRVQAMVRNEQGVDSLRETLTLLVPASPRRPVLYLAAIGISRYRNFLFERIPARDFQVILDEVSRIDERILLDCYRQDPGAGDWLLTSRAPLARRQAGERILRHFGYSRNLVFADKDARDLVAAWRRRAGRFARVHSLILENERVLRERFPAIRRFFRDSRPADTAVLFLAGHGLRDGRGEYWFGTHDIDFSAPEKRGYRLEELDALFDGIAAVNRLLLIDTCFSGEDPGTGDETRNRQLLLLRREVFADLARGAGSVVLASSAGFEAAYEGLLDEKGRTIENGIFTHALLKALQGEGESSLPVSTLVDRVTETVLRISGGRQTPGARRERIEFDFPLR